MTRWLGSLNSIYIYKLTPPPPMEINFVSVHSSLQVLDLFPWAINNTIDYTPHNLSEILMGWPVLVFFPGGLDSVESSTLFSLLVGVERTEQPHFLGCLHASSQVGFQGENLFSFIDPCFPQILEVLLKACMGITGTGSLLTSNSMYILLYNCLQDFIGYSCQLQRYVPICVCVFCSFVVKQFSHLAVFFNRVDLYFIQCQVLRYLVESHGL